MIGVFIGCLIGGISVGYGYTALINSVLEPSVSSDEILSMIEDCSNKIEEIDKSIEENNKWLDEIVAQTDEDLRDSVRRAIEAGVDIDDIIKNDEEGYRFFNS